MIRMITREEDHCGKQEDHKLPVLDVKEVANKKVMSATNAMPRYVKFATLVEEPNRRLRNTFSSILESRMKAMVVEFNARMGEAGHKETFRRKVTDAALAWFQKLKSETKEGRRHLHRNKDEIIEDRKENKKKRSKSG